MGRELQCRAKIGGKWTEGKALLETTEIIFRGEPRLKIPLASVTSAATRNGNLQIMWGSESAIFEIGEQSEKWAHAILHPKSTGDKLGLKPGLTISSIGMPLDTTMSDAKKVAAKFGESKPIPNSDAIFLGAATASDLAKASKLLATLAPNGALWIVYPKGRKEITELQVLESGRALGLYDVKVVSYSATHTALKFVRPKDKR